MGLFAGEPLVGNFGNERVSAYAQHGASGGVYRSQLRQTAAV